MLSKLEKAIVLQQIYIWDNETINDAWADKVLVEIENELRDKTQYTFKDNDIIETLKWAKQTLNDIVNWNGEYERSQEVDNFINFMKDTEKKCSKHSEYVDIVGNRAVENDFEYKVLFMLWEGVDWDVLGDEYFDWKFVEFVNRARKQF